MEYLYFKKKVAEMRKDLLRPENTPVNGRFAFSQNTNYSLVEKVKRKVLLYHSRINKFFMFLC